MKRIFLLTKNMMKSSSMGLEDIFGPRARKKRENPFQKTMFFVGVALILGLTIYTVFNISNMLVKSLVLSNQQSFILYAYALGLTVYSLFVSIISTPTIYYFSKDIERYLVLPLKPFEIMCAKFITNLISLYTAVLVVALPFAAAYYINVHPGFIFFINFLLGTLLLPILPIALATVMTVIMFRFVPLFRNKEFFTYVSTFVIVIISMILGGMGGYFGASSSIHGDPTSIFTVQLIDLPFFTNLNRFLPSIPFISDAMTDSNYLLLLAGGLLSIAVAAVGLFGTQKLYFTSIMNMSERTAKKRKLSDSETYSQSVATPRLRALIRYDFKNILRTPAFLMNYYVASLVTLVMIGMPFLIIGGGFSGLMSIDFMSMMKESLSAQEYIEFLKLMYPVSIAAGLGAGNFFSAFNVMASTSFSREGSAMVRYRSMPFALKELYYAKIGLVILSNLAVPVLLILFLFFVIKIPVTVVILFMISVIIGVVFDVVLSITSDIYKPKLIWDNEQNAVKQNFIAVIPMLVSFALVGLVALAVTLFGSIKIVYFVAILMIVLAFFINKFNLSLLETKLSKEIETI